MSNSRSPNGSGKADPLLPLLELHDRGWPTNGTSATHAPHYPLSEILTRHFTGEMFVGQYSCPEGPPGLGRPVRLNADALAQIEGGVTMLTLFTDIDAISKKAPDFDRESWWQAQQPAIVALLAAHPGLFIAQSQGGLRIYSRLATPVVLQDKEDAADWSARYEAHVAYMKTFPWVDAKVDETKDWNRLQRVPHDTRNGVLQLLATIGDPCNVGAVELPRAKTRAPRSVARQCPTKRVDMGAAPTVVIDALAACWPVPGEECHNAALALGGALADSFWTEDDAAEFSHALFARTGTKDRTGGDVLPTMLRARAGEPAKTIAGLFAILKNTGRGDWKAVRRLMHEQIPGLAPKVNLPQLAGIRGGATANDNGEHVTNRRIGTLSTGSATEVGQVLARDDFAEAVYCEGKLWRCNPTTNVWGAVDPTEIDLLVNEFDGVVYDYTDKGRPIWLRVSGTTRRDARDTVFAMRKRDDFFASAPVGVAFAGGTFVGLDGAEPLTPDHHVRSVLDFPWTPDVKPERTIKAMREWFAGVDPKDASARATVLFEHLGLSLLGAWRDLNDPGGTILLGEGANGKSVWLEVVRGIMPAGTVSSVPPQDFAHEYNRARLAGSRLNVCTEIPERQLLASGHTKAIFSYETVSARVVFCPPFEFRPECGHIFSCNGLPATEDQSKGFWRRWKVIRFPNKFEPHMPGYNPNLALDLLEAERPAIAAYAIKAALAALDRGAMTRPDSVDGELAKWREAVDQVAEFAAERLEAAPAAMKKDWIGLTSLFRTYLAWASEAGHKNTLTRGRFRSRLEGLGFSMGKTIQAECAVACRIHGGPVNPPQLEVIQGGKASG